jgi:hypothetical protein
MLSGVAKRSRTDGRICKTSPCFDGGVRIFDPSSRQSYNIECYGLCCTSILLVVLHEIDVQEDIKLPSQDRRL